MENNNNYTVSDYQKNDGGVKPYSKDDLLEILPKHFKFFFKITRVLEPKNDVRKKLLEWFGFIFMISMGINFGVNLQYSNGVVKPQFGLPSIANFVSQVVCIPIMYGLIKYFEDSGQNFYNLWNKMPQVNQQSVDKIAKSLRKMMWYFAGAAFLFTLSMVYIGTQDPAMPNWFILYSAVVFPFFALLMLYGYGNFFLFGICLIVCISHAANTEIIKIRTNVIQKFSDYKEEGEKVILKNFSNNFLLASAKLSKGYKYIGKILMIYLVITILNILLPLADTVINIVQGRYVDIVQLIFLFSVFMPIQVYVSILLLSTSISPSNEYTVFIEQLQKPDILFTISKIYGSEAHGMSYFFEGLETSRKDVVWKIFGIPLTFAVYQKVIGSLVSIIILSMTFALRSSVTL